MRDDADFGQVSCYTDVRGTLCVAEEGKELAMSIGHAHVLKSIHQKVYLSGKSQIFILRGELQILVGDQQQVNIEEGKSIVINGEPQYYKVDLPTDGIALVVSSSRMIGGLALDVASVTKKFGYPPPRFFYLKDIQVGMSRGGHAHRYCHQYLFCLEGCFEVDIRNAEGMTAKKLCTNDSLHIAPQMWTLERDFSRDSICLVFASHGYDRSGYMDD